LKAMRAEARRAETRRAEARRTEARRAETRRAERTVEERAWLRATMSVRERVDEREIASGWRRVAAESRPKPSVSLDRTRAWALPPLLGAG
jgi:hypothetical protein